jgi:murein DD-endopeptidase MepM/ murein hydrolase activator NlpD
MKLVPIALLTLAAACAPANASNAQGAAPSSSAPKLALPIACTIGKTCEIQNYVDRDPGPGAKDYRCGTHTYQAHNGVDIRLLDMGAQRAGVDVLAAAPGRVARLRDGVADISVNAAGAASVAGAECGNGVVIDHGGGWETQYCHLARGSMKVKQGDAVATGQPIARVGLSGNTEYPHLHMSVRKAGTIVDAFAPDGPASACNPAAGGAGLWTPAAAKAMAYKAGAVLNAGFAAAPVEMDTVTAGRVPIPTTASPMLIAYVQAIGLEKGDVQDMTLRDPNGGVLAQASRPPLDGSKAQYLVYIGKRAPAQGWTKGSYEAVYAVRRGGKVVLSRTFKLAL